MHSIVPASYVRTGDQLISTVHLPALDTTEVARVISDPVNYGPGLVRFQVSVNAEQPVTLTVHHTEQIGIYRERGFK